MREILIGYGMVVKYMVIPGVILGFIIHIVRHSI